MATREDTFAAKKAALIAGLEREYATFFQPMETELYSPDVEFVDPLINLNGVDASRTTSACSPARRSPARSSSATAT